MKTVGNQWIISVADRAGTRWIGFGFKMVLNPLDALAFDHRHEAEKLRDELKSGGYGDDWHVATVRYTLDMRADLQKIVSFYGEIKNAG